MTGIVEAATAEEEEVHHERTGTESETIHGTRCAAVSSAAATTAAAAGRGCPLRRYFWIGISINSEPPQNLSPLLLMLLLAIVVSVLSDWLLCNTRGRLLSFIRRSLNCERRRRIGTNGGDVD